MKKGQRIIRSEWVVCQPERALLFLLLCEFAGSVKSITQGFSPGLHHAFGGLPVCRARLPLHEAVVTVSGGVQCFRQQVVGF